MFVHILHESPVRLWGLSSRERIQKILGRSGVHHIIDDLSALPPQSSVLLIRGDFLYDGRVLQKLVTSHRVLLDVPVDSTRVPTAAHVPYELAPSLIPLFHGQLMSEILPIKRIPLESFINPYEEQLRKFDPPFVLPITSNIHRELEEHLFSGAYKGVTDLITKWVWPKPAQWATRVCVNLGITPNQVTTLSLILTVIAGVLFMYGEYGWGLLAGWFMTFLDTVDGKLARVTITSTTFGKIFDHGLDIIHPPLWYIAWGMGLSAVSFDLLGNVSLSTLYWMMLAGYILGRLIEGIFQLCFGDFGIFCWKPFDSYFRLITARRNPNLIFLTGSLIIGRPDLGFISVVAWTVLSTAILCVRLIMSVATKILYGPPQPWMADVDPHIRQPSLAAKLFLRLPTQPEVPPHE